MAVAHGLDDHELAAMLLAPFRLEELTAANAARLAGLSGSYGENWTRELLAGRSSLRHWQYAPGVAAGWLTDLPELCGALRGANGLGAARLVLAAGWEQLTESLRQSGVVTQPSRRADTLDHLAAPIAGLLVGAAISTAPEIVDAAVAVLADVQPHVVVSVLRAMPTDDLGIRAGSGFDALARNTLARIESWLARPQRQPCDWSIDPSGGCGCAVCGTLNDFLADSGLRAVDWPLKEQSRQHVHQQIDGRELPVKHATRRVGRPFLLQLVKTPALFEREKQARQVADADLQWLRRVALE